jgi:hypothetical protein
MNEAVFDNISSNTTVFLAARWGYYFRRSLINKEGPVWIRDEFSKERSAKENLNVLKRGIERTIRAIQNKGARVILVGSPPEFPQDIPARYWQFNEILSIPLSQHQAQTSPVSNIFDQAKDKYNISIIKLDNFFCEKDQCIAGKDSFLYFRDNDHISPNAAETLAPLFGPIFNAR